MKRIYKYHIPIEDKFVLNLPLEAKVLCVQVIDSEPYIWAEIDDTAVSFPLRFKVKGIGHPCDDIEEMRYVGTFQIDNGVFIFHLYMESDESES